MPAIADWLLYTRRYLDATYRVAFVRVRVVLVQNVFEWFNCQFV